MSTSEISVEKYMSDGGQKATGGMQTRLPDIPIDLNSATGVFNKPMPIDKATGKPYHYSAYARMIAVAATENCGVAGEAYLKKLVQEKFDDPEKLKSDLQEKMDFFIAETKSMVPPDCDYRVLCRFALLYAAGELALRYGVLPPECNRMLEAVSACMQASIGELKSQKPDPKAANLEKLYALISVTDKSVISLRGGEKARNEKQYDASKAVVVPSINGKQRNDALVKKEVFDALYDRPKAVAQQLVKDGILITGPENRVCRQDRIPGLSEKKYVYRIDLLKLEEMRTKSN